MARGKYVIAAGEDGGRPAKSGRPCPCPLRVWLLLLLLVVLVLVAAILTVIFVRKALKDNMIYIADGSKLFRTGVNISEGDMLSENTGDPRLMNAARDRNKLWPQGRVPYRIDDAIGCPGTPRCAVLLSAMDEYSSRTCIRWEAATRDDQPAVVVRYRPDDGCYSHVGYRGNQEGGKDQLIALGNGCFSKGILLHLLGHTLGLWHEHNRPDRDSWIRVNRTNIAEGHQESFHKFTQSQHHIVDRLDPTSIMMHGSRAFSGGRGVTMTSHWASEPLAEVWQKAKLSNQDVDRLQSMYIRQCSRRLRELETT